MFTTRCPDFLSFMDEFSPAAENVCEVTKPSKYIFKVGVVFVPGTHRKSKAKIQKKHKFCNNWQLIKEL